jgi:L-ribulose-5-phosphate 3-epimerase
LGDILNNQLGLYEKALPASLSWEERLLAAKDAEYDFVEISIDESDQRLERMKWTASEKISLKKSILKLGMPIKTMCLSGNRRYPIGSEDDKTRETGIKLIKDAIDFSQDIGIRIIQLAGYDEFYSPRTEKTKENFLISLKECVKYAESRAVMMAFETMETDFLDSIEKSMKYVNIINSPWLKVYPDIGNLTATKQDIEKDYMRGKDNIVGIHLKDTKIGIIRDLNHGEGIVDFVEFFRLLRKVDYAGPFVAEMWTDETDASFAQIKKSREFLIEKMEISKD